MPPGGLAFPSVPGRMSMSVASRQTPDLAKGQGQDAANGNSLPTGSAGRPISAFGGDDPSHVVETTTAVASRDGETFVTQRAAPSMFENRRTLQSTLLLQKKKEMNMVQVNLEKKRVEFAKRMEECREKQEELRAKQKQIRDRVTKFEKFLKENDAKRQRANLKAQSEKKLREQKAKEQELGILLHTLSEEQSKSENTLRLIKSYQIFEKYLQSVVDVLPPDYLDVNEPHINDILMRYKTLVETNEDLIRILQQSQDTIEKEATTLAELIKEKNDLILVYNSKLGTQQKRLDKLKLESAYTEQKLEERDNTGKERRYSDFMQDETSRRNQARYTQHIRAHYDL
ncbi:hypothetical protein HDU97_000909 [Phlyctochytrium planicorne]|nr:hypothetical protein HDU97_000909 [Phlyctochytrium planicorne]